MTERVEPPPSHSSGDSLAGGGASFRPPPSPGHTGQYFPSAPHTQRRHAAAAAAAAAAASAAAAAGAPSSQAPPPEPGAVSPAGEDGGDDDESARRSVTVVARNPHDSGAYQLGRPVTIDGQVYTYLSAEEAWLRLWRGEPLTGCYVKSLHLGYQADDWVKPADIGTTRYLAEHLQTPEHVKLTDLRSGDRVPALKYPRAVRIIGCVFESLSAVGVHFAEGVELRDVSIGGDIRMAPPPPDPERDRPLIPATIFDGEVTVRNVRVGGEWQLAFAEINGSFDVERLKLDGPLSLTEARLQAQMRLTDCLLRGHLQAARLTARGFAISDSKIHGRLEMPEATFDEPLVLDGVFVELTANLTRLAAHQGIQARRISTSQSIDLRAAHLHGESELTVMRLAGDLVLSEAQVHGPLSLYRTKIGDHLRAHRTLFEQRVSFQDVGVTDSADFRSAVFRGLADFRRASFLDWAIFFATEFHAGADFFGARFAGECLFNRDEAARKSWGNTLPENAAKIGAGISFSGAYFYRQAVFDGVRFPAEARFEYAYFAEKGTFADARFEGHADFDEVRAQQQLDFSRVHCAGLLSFRKATLEGPVELAEVKLTQLRLAGAVVEMLIVEPQEAGPAIDALVTEYGHTEAAQGYNLLKASYHRRGRLDDEDWAYAQFKRAKRKALEERLAGRGPEPRLELPSAKRLWQRTKCAVEALLFDKFSEYGTNPVRTLILALLLILFFGLIYTAADLAGEPLQWEGREIEALGGQRAIEDLGLPSRLMLNTYFSMMVFTTMGLGDVHPSYFGWVKVLVGFQAFVGVFVMTLFVGTYARKIIR